MIRPLSFLLIVTLPSISNAADPEWRPMLGDFAKTEKAGFGGLCGMVVDPATGDVTIQVSDRGFYRSTDGAKSFTRLNDTPFKGRTETPGCFLLDPNGKSKTLLSAFVYGVPCGTSDDGGKTWKAMETKVGHVDWCAFDWTDPEHKFVLALKHEAGELLLASTDAGKTFAEVGLGYGPAWVFDGKTAIAAEAKTKDKPKPGLVRTVDAGKTWTPCGDYTPTGSASARTLPRWHDGTLYWLVDGALIATADAGKTWAKLSEVKGGRFGPVFGATKGQMFVLAANGLSESTDGGATWAKPIAVPKEVSGGLGWLAYDPKSDSLYTMKMGSDLYKWDRKGK